MRKTWQLINSSINKKPKKQTTSFSSILLNDVKVFDPLEIANHFNEFFTTIAQTIADEITPTDKPPDLIPPSEDDLLFRLSSDPVTCSEIVEAIESLQPKNTLDIHGISVSFISKFALTISTPLKHIFNLSFLQGFVPQQFKIAKGIPIFKSVCIDSMDNYKPISLLPSLSKIMESIVLLVHFFAAGQSARPAAGCVLNAL